MVGKKGMVNGGEKGRVKGGRKWGINLLKKGDGIKFGKRRKGRKDGQGDFRKEEYLGVVVLKSN